MVASSFKNQKGFILAAVLWVLAIMLIAVGIFHAYVQRKLAVGIQAKAHIQDVLDIASTEQTLFYIVSTSRMTLAGITFAPLTKSQQTDEEFSYGAPVGDELWMDGTVYNGVGGSHFSIQDNAGLISLNAQDQSVLSQYLSHFESDLGVKARLLSALQDYIDSNDFVALSGAEKWDYQQQGLAPPTNDFLRSELELNRVMSWSNWLKAHPDIDVINSFSTRRFTLMNLNVMPKQLLMDYIGLAEPVAQQMVHERQTNPFRSVEDFGLRTGSIRILDEDSYRFFPGNEMRFKIWNGRGGQAKLISLQLTPNGLMGPWLVDYEYSVEPPENNNEPLAIRQSTLFHHSMDDDVREH
jgi:general secretion pathway protein K